MSEGVSEIYTSHSDRTVTQDGYLLSGAKTTVTAVQNGAERQFRDRGGGKFRYRYGKNRPLRRG